jgi:hypothetical protein
MTRQDSQWLYDGDCWFKLPIKLRARWWAETNYGRIPPSPELAALIAESIPNDSTKLSELSPPPPDPDSAGPTGG